jgi:hypothetical protein
MWFDTRVQNNYSSTRRA